MPSTGTRRSLPLLALLPIALLAGLPSAPARARADTDSTTVRALPPARWRAWQAGLVRPDRLQHASLSLAIGIGAGLATREPAVAVATPLTLGIAKELADARAPGFDPLDLAAGLAGAAVAGWVTARRFR